MKREVWLKISDDEGHYAEVTTDEALSLDTDDLLVIEFALRAYEGADADRGYQLAELMETARCRARDDGSGKASATLTYSAEPSIAEVFESVGSIA